MEKGESYGWEKGEGYEWKKWEGLKVGKGCMVIGRKIGRGLWVGKGGWLRVGTMGRAMGGKKGTVIGRRGLTLGKWGDG